MSHGRRSTFGSRPSARTPSRVRDGRAGAPLDRRGRDLASTCGRHVAPAAIMRPAALTAAFTLGAGPAPLLAGLDRWSAFRCAGAAGFGRCCTDLTIMGGAGLTSAPACTSAMAPAPAPALGAGPATAVRILMIGVSVQERRYVAVSAPDRRSCECGPGSASSGQPRPPVPAPGPASVGAPRLCPGPGFGPGPRSGFAGRASRLCPGHGFGSGPGVLFSAGLASDPSRRPSMGVGPGLRPARLWRSGAW
jgi:hypothetical protein